METPIGFAIATVRAVYGETTRSMPVVHLQTAAHALDRIWMTHCSAGGSSPIRISPSLPAQHPAATTRQPKRSPHPQKAPRYPRQTAGRWLGHLSMAERTGGGRRTARARTANAARLISSSPGDKACKTCSHSLAGMPSRIGPLECNNKAVTRVRSVRRKVRDNLCEQLVPHQDTLEIWPT